jgi:L-asparaginase
MFKNILILNTGGTFNKKYNPISGKLDVCKDSNYIKELFSDIYKVNKQPNVKTIISKDSLDIKTRHRELMVKNINDAKEDKIIIIHGTDTMNKTAKYIHKRIKNKTIILVGSMQPFSISKIEATGNLMMSIGFIEGTYKKGVFICMNGIVDKYKKVKKDYKKAVFKRVISE